MPPTPVDDHTEEFEQLAGLVALEVLDGDELVRFEQHAAGCARCLVMVRLDREALARAAPEMDPSPDFKQRLLARAAQELASAQAAGAAESTDAAARSSISEPPQASESGAEVQESPQTRESAPEAEVPRRARRSRPEDQEPRQAQDALRPPELRLEGQAPPVTRAEPTPLRRPPNVVPFWRRSRRWTSALAAVLVVALVSAGAFTYQNQVVASYPLSGTVAGSAVVQVRRSGAAELDLRGLSGPPAGFVYEAWVIPPGGQPIAAGVSPTGDATLPLNGVSNGTTIAITQERSLVDAPTSAPVLAAVVQL